jgi:hypothetical protein
MAALCALRAPKGTHRRQTLEIDGKSLDFSDLLRLPNHCSHAFLAHSLYPHLIVLSENPTNRVIEVGVSTEGFTAQERNYALSAHQINLSIQPSF